MPFVRISLHNEYSRETKDNISHAVHQSLIEEFNIPTDDYFQVFDVADISYIKFPANYLGIEHSADIIYNQITAAQGRTAEQKRKLYKQIAERIEATTKIGKNNIIIILTETAGAENWSFGNGEIQEMKHLKK